MKKFLKKAELTFKKRLKRVLVLLFPVNDRGIPEAQDIQKILVFRLDQRIGNGILLVPLLRAIKTTRASIELHLLIHHPVAELLQESTGGLIDHIWPYNQLQLIKQPWRMVGLFNRLRRERYDVVLTAHNPDNFSLSQALAGRWFKPGRLIGFHWKDSAHFYDIAVTATTKKHYADAMIDLWRTVDPAAVYSIGGMKAPLALVKSICESYPPLEGGGVLIWLGATGKKILPGEVFEWLQSAVQQHTGKPLFFAGGPADAAFIETYPESIREKVLIWREPLLKTAAFFSCFDLFISGDTGPMHLAAALGIPTITLFVDSNISQYGYNDGEKHFALRWEETEGNRSQFRKAMQKILAKEKGKRKKE